MKVKVQFQQKMIHESWKILEDDKINLILNK